MRSTKKPLKQFNYLEDIVNIENPSPDSIPQHQLIPDFFNHYAFTEQGDRSDFMPRTVTLLDPVIITYSFSKPSVKHRNILAERYLVYNHSRDALDMDNDVSLVLRALRHMEELFQIQFVENSYSSNLSFFKFKLDTLGNQSCETSNILPFLKGYAMRINSYEFTIGFNVDFFKSCRELGIPRHYKTVLHELAHAVLGFGHLFANADSLDFSIQPSQNLTSFSISNYLHEMSSSSKEYIYPITLMPFDIQTALLCHSPNFIKSQGNNKYFLREYAPTSSGSKYKTIATFVDSGGVDTVDASSIDSPHLLIDLRGNKRSDLGVGYVIVPEGIENVVAGEQSNTIVLNPLNNNVDLRPAQNPSLIVIDPRHCGQDTIIGFHQLDRILVTQDPVSAGTQWQIELVKGCDVLLDGEKIVCDSATRLIFDDNNHIDLINFESHDLTEANLVFPKAEATIELECQQSQQHASLPVKQWINDFSTSASRSASISFFTTLTQELLKQYKLSDQHIGAAMLCAQCLLAFTSGSTLAMSTTFVTGIFLNYLKFRNESCLLIGIIITELIKECSIENALTIPAKIGGSYLGAEVGASLARLSIWATDRVYQNINKHKNESDYLSLGGQTP